MVRMLGILPLVLLTTNILGILPVLSNAQPVMESRHTRRLQTLVTNTYGVGTTSFTVPAGVTALTVTLNGDSGGTAGGYSGGIGGMIQATFSVTPSEILYITVGNGGIAGGGAGNNGGGPSCGASTGGSGGSATDIRRSPYGLADRLLVAGGGGGAFSYGGDAAYGGNAGYASGYYGGSTSSNSGGGGGTSSGGGSGGGQLLSTCSAGTFGFGGSCCNGWGAGGGAGYYGGGGAYYAAGGGGSTYFDSSQVTFLTAGYSGYYGDGLATVTFTALTPPTAAPTAPPSALPTMPTSQPSSQPSGHPSRQPSSQPTRQPSCRPSSQPSGQPSSQPVARPSSQPSALPTGQPSVRPSVQPSGQPSARPSRQPSGQPSAHPSAQPSIRPSSQPSGQPSGQPSNRPSGQPSGQPSAQPSVQPSRQPSTQPSSRPSTQPSCRPSARPTAQPSRQPSSHPTGQPSAQPSGQPTQQPSTKPSGQPSCQPSAQPSTQPSNQPSMQPSRQPTGQPSAQPSSEPSRQPSSRPSAQPTVQPSSQPTSSPSQQPSSQPTIRPTSQPSVQPSCLPTVQPSESPTSQPSAGPTSQPSTQPSSVPSAQPTGIPSNQPTTLPTSQPSGAPSWQPSSVPTAQPSSHPSQQPLAVPSAVPTAQPSSSPSGRPSAQPSIQPSLQPTSVPSQQPWAWPTSVPSRRPSSQPTSQPSAVPSAQPSRQPSSQPSAQPTTQPSTQPTSVPTISRNSGVWTKQISNDSLLHRLAFVNNYVWACGERPTQCLLVDPANGDIVAKYPFAWDTITNVLAVSDATRVVVSGRSTMAGVTSSTAANCVYVGTEMSCEVRVLLNAQFPYATYNPFSDRVVYVGKYAGFPAATIMDSTVGSPRSYFYTSTKTQSISLSIVVAVPNFVGSFVAGTSAGNTALTAGYNYIVAGWVRVDTGLLNAITIAPASGSIRNSDDLVTTLAVEPVGPDSFIAGGIDLSASASSSGRVGMQAYVVRASALFRSVSYGVRYLRHSVTSTRRSLRGTYTSSSVVRGLVLIDAVYYAIVDNTQSTFHSNRTSLTVIKANVFTGAILQQVGVTAPNASLLCTDIVSSNLALTIVCTVRSTTSLAAYSVLLSVDMTLSFNRIPNSFVIDRNNTFYAESMTLSAVDLSMKQNTAVIGTSTSNVHVANAAPTAAPVIAPSSLPSSQPSSAPTCQPSSRPSAAPSVSVRPTSQPSTSGPTITFRPSRSPSPRPTAPPSAAPTRRPTAKPSTVPTVQPTLAPSVLPSVTPSVPPSATPSNAPSVMPSERPTRAPSTVEVEPVQPQSTNDRDAAVPPYVIAVGVSGATVCVLLGMLLSYRRYRHINAKKYASPVLNIRTSLPFVVDSLDCSEHEDRSLHETGAKSTVVPHSPKQSRSHHGAGVGELFDAEDSESASERDHTDYNSEGDDVSSSSSDFDSSSSDNSLPDLFRGPVDGLRSRSVSNGGEALHTAASSAKSTALLRTRSRTLSANFSETRHRAYSGWSNFSMSEGEYQAIIENMLEQSSSDASSDFSS